MNSESAGQDLWDEFENALSEGATAVDFWAKLDRSVRTLNVLVDLLLIEFESQGSEMSRIRMMVEQLECSSDGATPGSKLITGAYEIIVGGGCKPHIDMFDGLASQHERFLSLPTDPLHLGQFVGGRYRVEQRIGHGSFGVVYKFHDNQTGEKVACKAAHVTNDEGMSQTQRRQLTTEWIIMDWLSGRGCPKCFHLSTHDEVPFLTMEFIGGRSLREVIAESRLDSQKAAQILAEVSKTVAIAHQDGVIHRDLKPGNVLIDAEDNVFVVDFGLVGSFQFTRQSEPDPMIAGTRGYMAPEILSSARRPVDGRADIYSIGVMLHELLTEERPLGVDEQRNRSTTIWPDFIPRQLAKIGMRCLEQDPDDRYDAYELATALEAFVCGI